MHKYLFSVENEQDSISLDVNKIEDIAVKMFDYVIHNSDLRVQSVLNTYYKSDSVIGFDILICDNDEIHQINREYRKKDKPTDVISFALFADCPDSRIIVDNIINLGQIVISAEKTKEQAQENGKTFDDELYFLLSHGILHLLGFDHVDDDSLKFMLDVQDKIVNIALERELNVKI